MPSRVSFILMLVLSASLAAGCSNHQAALPIASSARGLPAIDDAERIGIREFGDLPRGVRSSPDRPSAIVAGSDGSLWVTDVSDPDYGLNAVVKIATSGKRLHVFRYAGSLSPGSELYDITLGPDGALWMPDVLNDQIVRMTTRGRFTRFAMPRYTAPFHIVAGPDNALWFTARVINTGAIGRITARGRTKIYDVSNLTSDIAAGSDGALWFTEYAAMQIGRITTNGAVTEFSNGVTSEPASIAPGPDGALWFTEPRAGRIGRITTSGQVTEHSRGITPTEQPQDIAAGPDGAMWFTEYATYGSYRLELSKIGRITMDGKIREYSKGLNPKAGPTAITTGPDGNMWFVTLTDKTGRVSL